MNATVMVTFLIVVLALALLLFAIASGSAQRTGRGRARRGGGRQSAVGRLQPEQFTDRWSTIQAMAAGGGNGLRTAVSEADKLLDHALRQSGVSGDTMGERLKREGGRLSDINGVWRAHKLRNALAHEVGFDLVPSQAREALGSFERALKDLGALK